MFSVNNAEEEGSMPDLFFDNENEIDPSQNFFDPFNDQQPLFDDCPSEYSEGSNPGYVVDPSEDSIHFTDCLNLKSVVSTLTQYEGGSFVKHLTQFPGLIIMPLTGCTYIRKPNKTHIRNPNILIYLPKGEYHSYQHLNNFNYAIDMLNK